MLYEFQRANGKIAFEHFDFDIEAQAQAERSNKILQGGFEIISVNRITQDAAEDKERTINIWP